MKDNDRIVEIVPLTTLPQQANQKYSYLLPDDLDVFPGALVKIPFANRIVEGVVWGKSKSNYSNLKTIIGRERTKIISPKDMKWLEQFSKASFESLSSLVKSLVNVRKLSGEPFFADDLTIGKKSSIKIKYTEDALEKTIKAVPRGQVLILIPEIIFGDKALEICKRLKKSYYQYNNHLSQKEKTETISALSGNRSCVIVATHSGIFLPFSNLTSIILIEPALPTHRQWNIHPHYDARVGAQLKSKLQNIPLTYISTLTSFDLFSSRKTKEDFLDLKNIVILNKNWGETGFISREIINLIRQNINHGKKILIFHNITGYESLYVCKDCGNTLRCEQCGSILQRQGKNLFCKKCKLVVGLIRAFCNICGSPKFNALKAGTRSIEQTLSQEFPHLNILRVDKEIEGITTWTDLLPKANIVIATQIIFSQIDRDIFDCSIIPDFSSMLGASNYNALEESVITLQRLNKLLKHSTSSHLFIQDAVNVSNILKYFISNNYLELINNDLRDRKTLSFPPFSLMMICEKEFSTHDHAKKEIAKQESKIMKIFDDSIINAHIYKRRSKFVGQITIRDNESKTGRILKLFSSSWSLDVPRSLSDFF